MRTALMLLVSCVVLGSGCSTPTANDKQIRKTTPPDEVLWATTSARIINIEELPDGKFCYSLEYNPTQSTAVNAAGKPIKGPIQQHYLGESRKPIEGQKIKMRYMREEPIIYELLEPIKYVDPKKSPEKK